MRLSQYELVELVGGCLTSLASPSPPHPPRPKPVFTAETRLCSNACARFARVRSAKRRVLAVLEGQVVLVGLIAASGPPEGVRGTGENRQIFARSPGAQFLYLM